MLLPAASLAQSPTDDWTWQATVHQLEWQDSSGPDAVAWDFTGWIGTQRNRLWIRDEGGHHIDGATRDNRLEVLWGHPVKYWEWLVGLRQDTGSAPSRTYFALGVQAEGPFGIWLESTGYLGDGSENGDSYHAGARLLADRDFPLSRRFTLGVRAEFEQWSEDHVRYTEGNGPSGIFASTRLRYAVSEGIAPYIGVEWFRLTGDTGDLARARGESVKETRFVAGIRLPFGAH